MDDYRGEEFLNKKNPSLHTSDEVMHSAEKSDSPKEKIRRYLDRLERITQKAMDNERTTSENDHNLLRNLYYRKYVIKKENVPDSHFELQEQIAMERGEGYLKHNEDSKEAERDYIVSEQKHSLDTWIDYLESEDANAYPMWFKYYALQGMVKLGSYNKVEGKFNKRTESTVSPFVELDREALAIVYDELNKYLNKEEINDEDLKKILDGGNFGKLYAYAIKKKGIIFKRRSKK